ncbi:MAG TPA: Calx-beta domain-containing protein [Leptolyngbyaceae cyanobacterium]
MQKLFNNDLSLVVDPITGILEHKPLTDSFADNDLLTGGTAESLQTAQNLLKGFATAPDFGAKMQVAFGNSFNVASANALAKTWIAGDFSTFPKIEIRNSAEINGAKGAFAAANNTIYLSREFLTENVANTEAVVSVLLEEIGHALDNQLNDADTPGDEGEIFSALVRGEKLEVEDLQRMKAEDDTATITLEGQEIQIEQANINLNQTINESLSSADPNNPTRSGRFADEYTLSGVSDWQQIQVNLNSSDFDSFLQLVNASTGELISSDDDSGGRPNAQISFTKYPGIDYLIRATSFDSGATGNYTLNTSSLGTGSSLIATLNGRVGTVDSLGRFTQIATGSEFFDIALSNNGQLFGITGSQLYRINPGSGSSSLIGNFGISESLNALEFASNNVLYGAGGSSLYTIDVNTGAASLVANLGSEFSSSGDLVFDAVNNRFFATSIGTTSDSLYSVTLAGQATKIGDIGFNNVYGLSFENRTLFGFTSNGLRIAINPATGAGTIDEEVKGFSGEIGGAASIVAVSPDIPQNPDTLPSPLITTGGNDDDFLIGGGEAGSFAIIDGVGGNDTIYGSDSNDSLVGGDGNDILQGIAIGDVPGLELGGIDSMFGGAGQDIFILGVESWPEAFYDDGDNLGQGTSHYVIIEDLNPNEDQIQLKGIPADYILGSSPIPGVSGTGVYLDKPGNEPDELIGIIRGVLPSSLNLNSNYFLFPIQANQTFLEFSALEFRVAEDGTPITAVTVIRSGGTDGSVSATLNLSNGNAIAPDDYDNTAITVNFAPGETQKTITVPIINDTSDENDETIALTLANPTGGAAIGQQNSATLVIVDNDNDDSGNVAPDIASKHKRYEFFVKDSAYGLDWQIGDDVGNGYKVNRIFEDSKTTNTGFFALGLTSDLGETPLLAIRGTEPTKITDILADTNPFGIGFNQFQANKTAVTDWLNEQNQQNRTVDITGHSLGGALTQLLAADFTSRGGKLGEVVTFNSPGIDREQVGQFKAENAGSVTHYIVSGDLVSLAGEAFLPGKYELFSYPGLLDYLKNATFNKHLNPVLVDAVGYNGKNPEAGLTIQKGIERKSSASVEPSPDNPLALNSPLFTYIDPDFFTFVLAASSVTQKLPLPPQIKALPPFMLFRSTLEAKRQEIGRDILQNSNVISNINGESGISGRVFLPNIEFNLLNLLKVEARELGMQYVTVPEEILKIQGKVTVPALFNATAQFVRDDAEDNFIQISDRNSDGALDLDVVGSLSVKDIPIVPGVWGVNEAKLTLDTIRNEVKGEGTILIPTGIAIGGGLGIRNGQFNFISLKADNLNKPIGTTGAFLQRISGQIDKIATPAEIEFGGGVGLTAGPKLDVPFFNLEDVSLLALDLDAKINAEQVTGIGKIKIIDEKIANGQGDATLNWNKKFLKSEAKFSFLDGLIQADKASFSADANFNITIDGNASSTIPSFLPYKGTPLGSGRFLLNFSNDGNLSNDFVAAYGKINTPLNLSIPLGFKGFFDGKFELGLKDVPQTNSFTVAPGTQWILLNGEWENAATNVPIQVKMPNGTILNESDFAATGKIAIVDELTNFNTKAVIVLNPEPGVWDINVANPTDLGNVQYSAFRDSAAPSIQVTSPATDITDSNVTINYNAFDADSNAKVSLFYDTDNQGFDGILIADNLAETDGAGSFVWNTEGVATGDYYVYAMVMDENNAPVFSYSPGRVKITESADLSVTKTVNENPDVSGNFTYTLTVTNNGPNDAKGATLTDTLPEGVTLVAASLNPAQQSGNDITFDLGDLANGASKTVNVTITPPPNGTITGIPGVTSRTFDPDVSNDFALASSTVSDTSTNFIPEIGTTNKLVFDDKTYLSLYPDVRDAYNNGGFEKVFDHFTTHGVLENRDLRVRLFDETYYLDRNSDVKQAVDAGGYDNAYDHFILWGINEGRQGSSSDNSSYRLLFDENYYLGQYPEVKASVDAGDLYSGLIHYFDYGQFEGRQPSASDNYLSAA